MNIKTLKELDYYKIRDEIADYCVSAEGKKALLEREPFKELNKIDQLKKFSQEWESYLHNSKSNPLKSWDEIFHLFAIIKTSGTSLNLTEVKALGMFCLAVENIIAVINENADKLNLKALLQQVQSLPDMQNAKQKIFRIITADGEIRDLPQIAAIRAEIAKLNQKLKNIMKTYTSDQRLLPVLESTVPVLRNGRQVLAVKASAQNKLPGIVHEVSQTGQTVYIEPDEAVRCSNELIQKEYELQAEIKKILQELTLSLQSELPDFSKALPVMKTFDGTLAAARWGIANNCVYAQNCVNNTPALLKARHPLLGEKCVPIDISFLPQKRVLIITGPNTGGKTVTLKTFALLAMLNQSGFPVPCAEGSYLPIFNNVFADIGDDQSLEQSLSTFSGHMKNIAQAINGCTDKSLILLDELGSGTDPQEGSAIAMAVLDKFIQKKCFVLVTTHQGVLKNYGYTNPSCINASVEFNTSTLSPSYKLLMGVPGESHALDIAQHSGLPKEICNAARQYIATEQTDVSKLIKGLNSKHIELDKLKKQAQEKLDKAEESEEKLRKLDLQLRKKEHELKLGKQQELNDFLIHSRRQLENLVRSLKEGEITREKTLAVKGFISELEKDTSRIEKKLEHQEEVLLKQEEDLNNQLAKKHTKPSTKKTKKKLSNKEALEMATPSVFAVQEKQSERPLCFEEGAVVVSGNSKNEGVLIKQERKGVWQVQFGSVKMSVKQKDLTVVRQNASVSKPSISVELNSYDYSGNSITEKALERPRFELRLLGMRADEAIKVLERQIDLCVLNNFLNFSVIHGKGDGVLQQVVTDYLSNCPVVEHFEFAPAEDGGAGKTYVSIKS